MSLSVFSFVNVYMQAEANFRETIRVMLSAGVSQVVAHTDHILFIGSYVPPLILK